MLFPELAMPIAEIFLAAQKIPTTGAYCRRIRHFESLLFCLGHCYDNLLLLLRPLNANTEFLGYKPSRGVCAVVFDKRRQIIFFDPRGIERKALCHFLGKIVLVFKLFIGVHNLLFLFYHIISALSSYQSMIYNF